MRKKTILVIVLSLLTMLVLTSSIQSNAHAVPPSQIYIGVCQSYSGVNAPGCMMHQLYYAMIIADYNAKGGLYIPEYGKRINITLVPRDDESDIAKCLDGIVYLITEAHVDLMFAPWSTEFNAAADDVFEFYKMPAIGLTVGSDALAQRMINDEITYSFVTLGQPWEDAIEIVNMLKYCNGTLGSDAPRGHWSNTRISKIGILYRSDLHGTEHSTAIGDALTAAGFDVWKEAYATDIATFVPIITGDLEPRDLDVVMIMGYGEACTFYYQCMALNYSTKMMFHGPVLETPLMMYLVFGFTPGQITGLTYYDGFPATNYTTPTLAAWAEKHKAITGFYPFPAAAPAFYTGVECLFKAVEEVGLNHTLIRNALRTQWFNTTLMGMARLRIGQSIEVQGCGTISQWQGKEMEDVIWGDGPQVTKIEYPKFPWAWAAVPDINRDGKVDMKDVRTAAKAFGSYPGHSRWNFIADWNRDNTVDMKDIRAIAKAFGKDVANYW